MEFIDSLRELNVYTICFRVILSLFIGGCLGLERGKKNRAAGFRTYMLVCLGANLVMMTNLYVFQTFHTSDPVRMGAQVVSGIGFLGAGTIIVTGRHQIKGVTTAAGLWTAACCGLAIGIGFYEGAIICGATVLLIMAPMNYLEEQFRKRTKISEFYVEFGGKRPFSSFLSDLRANGIEITDIQVSKNKLAKDVTFAAVITVKSLSKRYHSEIVQIISETEGVLFVEEL